MQEAEAKQALDATEDEYFEQELLDFIQIVNSCVENPNPNSNNSLSVEPKEELQCIIERFNKLDFPMPSDQWLRVYAAFKKLSQLITKHSQPFENWTLLRTLFESAKAFRGKYPTAEHGEKIRQRQQKTKNASAKTAQTEKMNQVLKFAKEFADESEPTTKPIVSGNAAKGAKIMKPIKSKSGKKVKDESSPSTSTRAAPLKPDALKTENDSSVKPGHATRVRSSSKSGASTSSSHSPDRSHRHRDHRSHHRSHTSSRSRSRSRERHHHHRARKSHHYRSRSRSRTREHDRERDRDKKRSSGPLDAWGLPPPVHSSDYIENMMLCLSDHQRRMQDTDRHVSQMETLPVRFGDSEICHGFNEKRCRLDPCKYQHVCWSCKSREHPSAECPYKATRPYDAPGPHIKPCFNWNFNGCNGGCLCAERHVCIFCSRQHPIRHSKVCLWKYHREVEMGKRKPVDLGVKMRQLQNLNNVGQFEHLRLKDEESGGVVAKQYAQKLKQRTDPNSNGAVSKDLAAESSSSRFHSSHSIHSKTSTTPLSAVGAGAGGGGASSSSTLPSKKFAAVPTSFMAKGELMKKEENISITEVCVLFNTPSGCPAQHGKGDEHSHGGGNTTSLVENPNAFDGVCRLKHRCRACFGRHSFFACPFRLHGVQCLIVHDIVRYRTFPDRVYVLNGFKSSHAHGAAKIKMTEVGLDTAAAQIEVDAKEVTKIVSSVQMHYKYPKLMIRELPTTVSASQVEQKLRLLFHNKQISNVVDIQSTTSPSNWLVSFLSVADRLRAYHKLKGCTMQARELELCILDSSEDNSSSHSNSNITNDRFQHSLTLVTKDEVPIHEHLYYCALCDVSVFEYGSLRTHLKSSSHSSLVHRQAQQSNHAAIIANEQTQLNECILCNTTLPAAADGSPTSAMAQHITTTPHDNSNILMMLSLVRCAITNHYHCKVCNVTLPSSKEFFMHCNSEEHRSGLEETIEPCPYFNRRGDGCQNKRCQFKHVCVGCSAVTPVWRCKRCKHNEVCNMYNKGGSGCWYGAGSCHRRHVCNYCHGPHPKVGCPKLYPNSDKKFNSQGQQVNGEQQTEAQTRTSKLQSSSSSQQQQQQGPSHQHRHSRAFREHPQPRPSRTVTRLQQQQQSQYNMYDSRPPPTNAPPSNYVPVRGGYSQPLPPNYRGYPYGAPPNYAPPPNPNQSAPPTYPYQVPPNYRYPTSSQHPYQPTR